MLNRPLSQPVMRLSGRRLMAAGRGYQYRGDEGKLGWLGTFWAKSPSEAATSRGELNTRVDSGAWQTRHAGGLGPKTCLLWQLITLLKSRTRPMDHLPPASSQPKDSGSSSFFTQEGVQQSDSIRWCVEIRVTNVRLLYCMMAENCQYIIIYYIYLFPIRCCHNDPISPRWSLNFHLISSAKAPLSRHSPPCHPPPTPSLNHVLQLKFILHATSCRRRCSPVPKQSNDGVEFNLNLAVQHAMPRRP